MANSGKSVSYNNERTPRWKKEHKKVDYQKVVWWWLHEFVSSSTPSTTTALSCCHKKFYVNEQYHNTTDMTNHCSLTIFSVNKALAVRLTSISPYYELQTIKTSLLENFQLILYSVNESSVWLDMEPCHPTIFY